MVAPPKNRIPTHPGQILLLEFLAPLGLTQTQLSQHLNISIQRINEIVNGKRGITPETAWLFAQAFGTTAEIWMGLQASYDLAMTRPTKTIASLNVKRK